MKKLTDTVNDKAMTAFVDGRSGRKIAEVNRQSMGKSGAVLTVGAVSAREGMPKPNQVSAFHAGKVLVSNECAAVLVVYVGIAGRQ